MALKKKSFKITRLIVIIDNALLKHHLMSFIYLFLSIFVSIRKKNNRHKIDM